MKIGEVFFEHPEHIIHSLHNYLLSTCYVPGTVLGFIFEKTFFLLFLFSNDPLGQDFRHQDSKVTWPTEGAPPPRYEMPKSLLQLSFSSPTQSPSFSLDSQLLQLQQQWDLEEGGGWDAGIQDLPKH